MTMMADMIRWTGKYSFFQMLNMHIFNKLFPRSPTSILLNIAFIKQIPYQNAFNAT